MHVFRPTEVKSKQLTILCYVTYVTLSIPFNLAPIFLSVLEIQYAQPGEEKLSDEELGRLTATPFLGVSISTIATALLADKYGAKPAALFGNFLTFFGLILSGCSTSYYTLLVSLFFLGLGAGAIDMVIPPLVSTLNAKNRGAHMNYLNAIYWLGAVGANLFVISALFLGLSFNQCCFCLAPLPMLMFVLMIFFAFPSLTEGAAMPFLSLIKNKWFQLSMYAIALGGATSMGLANWLNYYVKYLGFSNELADWMLLLYGVAMFLGRMIVGCLSSKNFSLFTILLLSCAVSFALFVLTSFGPPELCVVCALLVGVTASPMWPTILAVTADEFRNGGPLMFGLLSSLGNIGGFFMPWLVGIIAEETNLRWGLATASLAAVLMIPAVYWMKKTKKGEEQWSEVHSRRNSQVPAEVFPSVPSRHSRSSGGSGGGDARIHLGDEEENQIGEIDMQPISKA